jgi:NTE family protein
MNQPIERLQAADGSQSRRLNRCDLPGQVVLVLQGGGALGSYQAGVYQALQEARIEPDWIIGTSIGAINASLIAGNEPRRRLERLRAFWGRVQRVPHWSFQGAIPGLDGRWS